MDNPVVLFPLNNELILVHVVLLRDEIKKQFAEDHGFDLPLDQLHILTYKSEGEFKSVIGFQLTNIDSVDAWVRHLCLQLTAEWESFGALEKGVFGEYINTLDLDF